MKAKQSAAKSPATPAGALDWRKWNFDSVEQWELTACVWWEYARESTFIRDTLRRYRKWLKAGGSWQHPDTEEIDRNLRQIQEAIPYESHVFLSGCCFDRARNWQSDDRHAPRYKHPDAPPITGSFPDPWQSLHEDEKKARACIGNDKEALRLVPVKLGHWCFAKDIAAWCELRAAEQHRARLAWEREHMAKGGYPKPGAPDPPASPEIRPGLFIGAGESVLLEIGWQSFSNEEIARYFREVLPALRPPGVNPPNRKTHPPRSWRADLTRLAILRLLKRYTLKEIFGTSGNIPDWQAIQDAKQFAADRWQEPNKWSDAKREAVDRFRELFPFLPEGEKPRSWRA